MLLLLFILSVIYKILALVDPSRANLNKVQDSPTNRHHLGSLGFWYVWNTSRRDGLRSLFRRGFAADLLGFFSVAVFFLTPELPRHSCAALVLVSSFTYTLLIGDRVYMSQVLDAIVVVMCCFSSLKYFKLNRTSYILINSFGRALKPLLAYLAVFCLVFIGFCLLFHNLYGQQVYEFRQITSTSKALLVTLLGKVEFGDIFDKYPVWAQIFFICYIVSVYFVLLSMFLAILNEAFMSSNMWAAANEDRIPRVTFAQVKRIFADAYCGCFKKGKSREQQRVEMKARLELEQEGRDLAAAMKAHS